MELDAFTSNLGLGQGRTRRGSLQQGSGDYVFVLGDREPGRYFNLAPGDHAEVRQDVDLTDLDLVRARLTLQVPPSLLAGLAWEASIVVDDACVARTTARAGRSRTITDLAANVSKLSGTHSVGVRLALVEA